jgi:hypothetical protein
VFSLVSTSAFLNWCTRVFAHAGFENDSTQRIRTLGRWSSIIHHEVLQHWLVSSDPI